VITIIIIIIIANVIKTLKGESEYTKPCEYSRPEPALLESRPHECTNVVVRETRSWTGCPAPVKIILVGRYS
jgi:hypothetical protein